VFFGAITLIASVFGDCDTQYISVLERTREIGLMKSLGMRSRDVRRLFTLEAAWIGFIGGMIRHGYWHNSWATNKPVDQQKVGRRIYFSPRTGYYFDRATGFLIAVIAGFLPARKAAKLDPIESPPHRVITFNQKSSVYPAL